VCHLFQYFAKMTSQVSTGLPLIQIMIYEIHNQVA
jgi:hypothetical protein